MAVINLSTGGHFTLFCADLIDKTLTFHLIPNLSHLEHMERCYMVINAKTNLNFGRAVMWNSRF